MAGQGGIDEPGATQVMAGCACVPEAFLMVVVCIFSSFPGLAGIYAP